MSSELKSKIIDLANSNLNVIMLESLHSKNEKKGLNTRDESGNSEQTLEQHRSIFANNSKKNEK